MRRMRTISQAAAWAKQTDPETALTFSALRRIVLAGEIPHVLVGIKRLIALEDLETYLETGTVTPSHAKGSIRPVEVRQ